MEVVNIAKTPPDFVGFPSIARLSRTMSVTEKLDGTNSSVHITEYADIFPASRNRWITVFDDNFGFARWVEGNKDELLKLGPGTHFGEWWGYGIQRGYGLPKGEKRFSLFNTARWHSAFNALVNVGIEDLRGRALQPTQCIEAPICHVVPLLTTGQFSTESVDEALQNLQQYGSYAAPGFMKPEGVVVYHEAARALFKKTIERDEAGKSAHAKSAA